MKNCFWSDDDGQCRYCNYCKQLIVLAAIFLLSHCKSGEQPQEAAKATVAEKVVLETKVDTVVSVPDDEVVLEDKVETEKVTPAKATSASWTELTEEEGISLDIRYATTNNFTKKQIYDCAKCYMRPEAAQKLKEIDSFLAEKYGYGLKVFDCFRPRPYQQRLWDIVPNPDYVTPPQKGSMHSRGLAVDLTIVDAKGKELNMGTPFDFFGKEAHQDFKRALPEINKNRSLLRSLMEKNGFASIRTEWWHYSYSAKSYPLDSWVWDCVKK
ncbi:MAG: M15 family metallopeptidase [Saprospiraceae bacterium]|nr:M15 family metallopeptidase [Saprospiraceae bacterium]